MRGTSVNTTLIRSGPYKASTKPTVVLSWDVGNSFLSPPKLNKQAVDKQFMLIQFMRWTNVLFFFSSSSTSSVFAQQALLLSNILTFLCCSCLNWIFHSGRCRGSDTVVMRIAAPFQQQRIHYKGFLSFFPPAVILSLFSLSLFFLQSAWKQLEVLKHSQKAALRAEFIHCRVNSLRRSAVSYTSEWKSAISKTSGNITGETHKHWFSSIT